MRIATWQIAALAGAIIGMPLVAGAQDEDVAGREAYFWAARSFPSGVRPYAQMAQARQSGSAALDRVLLSAGSPFTGSWRAIGPYGFVGADNGFFGSGPQLDAGRVVGIQPPRVNGGPFLIATASGGVWRASALGGGWVPVTDNQCWLNMGAIVSDPVNPSIIYAGTGEYNDFSLGCGVLRSVDGGNSWTSSNTGLKLTNGASAIFGSLYVDPTTAGSTTATTIVGATANSLVRSTNSGSNWAVVLAGSPSSLASTKPGTIFAGMRDFSTLARNGVWKSANTGQTWAQLPALPNVSINNVGRIELAVSAAAPDRVYAIVGNATDRGLLGVFVYNDVAGTWTQLTASGITTVGSGRGDFGKQSEYDLQIAVDPRDGNRIYLAGVRAYRSTDGGATFKPMAMEIHCDWHSIVIDPRNPDIMYAGTDGGFFVSTDAGDTWRSQNAGLAITQYYPGISVHPSGTQIMGGAQDNGTHVFNGTVYWEGFNGGDGGYTAINYLSPDIMYGESQWSTGAHIVRRQGTSFTARNSGIGTGDRAEFIPPFVIDPVTPTTLYFGTQKLYKTINEGTLWTALASGADLTFGTGDITTIAVAPTDVQTIYVGASDGMVKVTRNGGTTFTQVTTGLPTRAITKIVVDPTSPTHAVLTVQGYGSGAGHVFETTTAGTTWSNISGNLIDVGANSVAFVGGTANLFVATDIGVYQTADGGASWTTGPLGMPNVIVNDIAYQAATNTVVAATYGRGMFTYIVGGTAAVLRGDANGDGAINAADALLVQQTLVSSLAATTAIYPRGDANCNGAIDAADVVLILRKAVGLSTTGCVGATQSRAPGH